MLAQVPESILRSPHNSMNSILYKSAHPNHLQLGRCSREHTRWILVALQGTLLDSGYGRHVDQFGISRRWCTGPGRGQEGHVCAC